MDELHEVHEGWHNFTLEDLLRAADRCAALEAENARLREAIRRVLPILYPPGSVYRVLTEALGDE